MYIIFLNYLTINYFQLYVRQIHHTILRENLAVIIKLSSVWGKFLLETVRVFVRVCFIV